MCHKLNVLKCVGAWCRKCALPVEGLGFSVEGLGGLSLYQILLERDEITHLKAAMCTYH